MIGSRPKVNADEDLEQFSVFEPHGLIGRGGSPRGVEAGRTEAREAKLTRFSGTNPGLETSDQYRRSADALAATGDEWDDE